MKFGGWQRLNAESAKQFGVERPSWPAQGGKSPESRLIMSQGAQRSIFRFIHIVFAIPILGYVYSPFEKIPQYAPATRFVFVPLLIVSGLWMWKGHVLRRMLLKRSA